MLQGHALFARQAGGANPCPLVDFVGGFNQFFARAYGLNGTIEQTYGQAFNPFLNDQNYFLSVVTLEELGATGNIFFGEDCCQMHSFDFDTTLTTGRTF